MLPVGYVSVAPWIVIVVVVLILAAARRRRAADRMRAFEQDVLRSLPGRGGGSGAPPAARTANLKCTSCGASAAGTDISPKGEVKCPYCGTWFDAYR